LLVLVNVKRDSNSTIGQANVTVAQSYASAFTEGLEGEAGEDAARERWEGEGRLRLRGTAKRGLRRLSFIHPCPPPEPARRLPVGGRPHPACAPGRASRPPCTAHGSPSGRPCRAEGARLHHGFASPLRGLAPLARVQPRTLRPAWPAATLTKAPRPACVSPSLAARMLGATLSRAARACPFRVAAAGRGG